MIVGLGLDVVDVARLRGILEGPLGARFAARVFTPAERTFCDAHAARAVHYAGRFAAKEALVKALGAPAGVGWQDMEVASGGPPRLAVRGKAAAALEGRGGRAIHLSLSHDGGLAVAAVVVEG
ncbi:MAG TPA: holo-ACP synthase [Myxococcales bacterium]|nr:holo-ACP synthase [Myxococcales bacterium]